MCHVYEREKHVYAVVCVHPYEKHVSCETWILTVCGSWHIGSKWSPKLTLFFNIVISFSIIEEEVEHAIGTLDDEA